MAKVGQGAITTRIDRVQHGEPVGVGAQFVLEECSDVVGFGRQLCSHEIGVDERLLLRCGLVLVEQVAAGESVGDPDQDDAGQQRNEGEEEGDPRTKTKSPTPSHEDRVLQVDTEGCVRDERCVRDCSPAAGEVPGGGRYLTGAA